MRRLVFVYALVLAVAAGVALGATAATSDESTPPTLIQPAAGAAIASGTRLTFTVSTFAGDRSGYLWLHVSRSAAVVDACGTIGDDVEIEPFAATSDPSVYVAAPAYFGYSGFWMNQPGTYYWQAHRIHHGGGADGCIESEVRSFRIVGTSSPSTPTTPDSPTTPTPARPAQPLANARLAGEFDLSLRFTSVSGLGDAKRGSVQKVSWTFQPTCVTGACAVRLQLPKTLFGGRSATVRLNKAGARYAGAGTAYLTRCSVTPVGGTMRVDLRVAAGRWIDGRWRATRVSGSMRYAAPATTTGIWRCKPVSLSATVRGTLDLGY